MSEVSDVRKAFEGSLRRIDRLTEVTTAEQDKIKAEFEQRVESVRVWAG